jgi:hypothetical protein
MAWDKKNVLKLPEIEETPVNMFVLHHVRLPNINSVTDPTNPDGLSRDL